VTDNAGNTALHKAVWSKDCVEALLQHGVDVNVANADGITPLHISCLTAHSRSKSDGARRDDVDVFQRLLAAGAECTVRTAQGDNVLHLLARTIKVDQLRLLLDKQQQAGVLSTNLKDGATALHKLVDGINICVLGGPEELLQQRRQASVKASKSSKRKKKEHADADADDAIYAAEGVVNYAQAGTRPDLNAVRTTIDLLLQHGLDVDTVDTRFGETPLLKAVRYKIHSSPHCRRSNLTLMDCAQSVQ
jgi:ankyrin repeat protein